LEKREMRFRVQGREQKRKKQKRRPERENLLFSPSTFMFFLNLTLLKLN
jgi:hypothetical protein